MEEKIMWLVGVLVCAVLVITTVIPTAVNVSTNFNAPGTATAEVWNGTASTVKTLTYKPLVSVTDFRLSTPTSDYNDTSIAGNGSINTTTSRIFPLVNFDDGAVSGKKVNVTVKSTVGVGGNVSVYANGVFLGITTGPSDSWNGITVTRPLNITIVRGGVNLSTVSNVTVAYNYWAANTNYSVTSTSAAQLTPTVTGTFYTTYTYGTATTGSTLALVILLPLLIAVVLFMLFMKSSGVF